MIANVAVAVFVEIGLDSPTPWLLDLAVVLSAGFLPVAIGVAVLHYRLYIDRLVSRTVSCALLTGVLASVYVASVLLLSRLLAPLGAGSELAMAAATLAAAGAGERARASLWLAQRGEPS